LAPPPPNTAHGALLRHLIDADPTAFQPMNVNFGLFPAIPDLSRRVRKREKYERYARRALEDLAPYAERTASVVA
jgi:methylenetetrahydrofolate--tRNA-(uracil-5-)-methyltransferase